MADRATIDLLTVQFWDGAAWDDWTGTTASVSIQRGGAVTVDVGTMTVVLIRDDDPLADELIVPGQPVRVVRHGTTNPIFTGIVQDAGVGIVRDPGGTTRNAVTVAAVDAVSSHVKNTRYGAVSAGGAGHETFVARITRLATSSETTVSLPSEPSPALPWQCQDVAYVSSLASHFDLACQTVGANWYVDRSNVTRFRLPNDSPPSVGTFSDQITAANQYDDIVIDSGTKQVVNVLKITNHGRANDENALDITTIFEDTVSSAEWGARSASTDMSLWDADTYLSGRADEVFAAFADPVREVSQVVWDAQQNTTLAASLEIQSPLTVLFGAETFTTRIVTLSHEIGPSSWRVTIGTSTRGVPPSQAVNDLYGDTPATGEARPTIDLRQPAAPTGVTASPFAAWSGGTTLLAAQVEWNAVTVGDNGAPITVTLYEVWARPNDGATPAQVVGSTSGLELTATDPAFAIGDEWLVKVRAQSANAVWSDFSSEDSVIFTDPGETLDPPATPILTSSNGVVMVATTGLFATTPPTEAPDWFREFRIERATAAGGPYVPAGVLNRDVDVRMFSDMAIGDTWWFRLVGVDILGRDSTASTVASITVVGIDGDDLIVNSLSGNRITAGTITVDRVQAGFGNSLEIGGNLTIISAQADIAAVSADVSTVASDLATVDSDLATMQTYYSFGASGAIISSPGSEYSQRIASNRTEMRQGTQVMSYWEAGQMFVPRLVADKVQLGNHSWEKATSGSVIRALS